MQLRWSAGFSLLEVIGREASAQRRDGFGAKRTSKQHGTYGRNADIAARKIYNAPATRHEAFPTVCSLYRSHVSLADTAAGTGRLCAGDWVCCESLYVDSKYQSRSLNSSESLGHIPSGLVSRRPPCGGRHGEQRKRLSYLSALASRRRKIDVFLSSFMRPNRMVSRSRFIRTTLYRHRCQPACASGTSTGTHGAPSQR